MNTITKILTQGLHAGYAGTTKPARINRSGFNGLSCNFLTESGDRYHDEWFVPSYIGGGQELVSVEGQLYTRLYGGGTPPPKLLQTYGVTIEEVGAYLKKKIIELKDKTRLKTTCVCKSEASWKYKYEVLLYDPATDVTIAVESIWYKDTRVHIHPFILSPVA